jgi:hypothetical protein
MTLSAVLAMERDTKCGTSHGKGVRCRIKYGEIGLEANQEVGNHGLEGKVQTNGT